MSITEGKMTWGQYDIKLRESTPRSVISKLDSCWYGLIRVYKQRVIAAQVGAVNPLYTGVLLERVDRWTIGGHGGAWFLGEASDGAVATVDELGPLSVNPITKNGTSTGTLTDWVDAAINDTATGLSYSIVTSIATKYAGEFTRRTAKTILDSWVCPRFGVVYRVGPDLVVYVGDEADVYPDPSPGIVAVPGNASRDLGLTGINGVQLGLVQNVNDQVSRVITVIDDPSTYQALSAGGWPYKNPNGDPLNWTLQKGGSASSQATVGQANTEAAADASAELLKRGATTRTISVSSDEYAITGRIAPGQTIRVFHPDEGLFDKSNPPLEFAGRWIFPVSLNVTEVAWPVEYGMGVFLDDRHQSGDTLDLTPYVDFTSKETVNITVGAPPHTLNRNIRPRRRR